MQRVTGLLKRFHRDERGVFAVFFALIAIVLIAAAGAVVDFTRVQQARTRAQIAIDSAALALQAKVGVSGYDADYFREQAQDLLDERMGDDSITAVIETATPDDAAGKLTITGYISVPTYFVQLVGINDIRASMLSEVTRSSSDLEVALSIDITGSMARTTCEWWEWHCTPTDKIGDLIDASNMLIDTLVLDDQEPTYSKMAIVPWSNVVNPGSYLTAVRGTPDSTTRNINGASWATGTAKSIQSITRGSTYTTINSNNHGFADGSTVYISGVGGLSRNGNSCINDRDFLITWVSNNSYRITRRTDNCTSATNNTGTGTKCQAADCELVISTSAAHGYSANQGIHVTDADWLGTSFMIRSVPTVTSIVLQDKYGPTSSGYVAGGKTWCGEYGCSRRVYKQGGSIRDYPVAPCVTERETNHDTDTSPGITPLGYLYNSSATCLSNQIVPLTSDKDVLHAAIGPYELGTRTLVASGNTAGHLGLAWGWYMIAPNFAYVWPVDSRPKAYNANNLIKAIVFMTDGVFNQEYCSGIGNGQACTNANGDSEDQAEDVCDAIKQPANDTVLYVVGFDLADDEDTLEFLRDCATSVDKFYQADSGDDLEAAFRSIAGDLSALRVSR